MVNLELLTELQEKRDRFPHAMTAYIVWLQGQYDSLSGRLETRHRHWRAHFHRAGSHLRMPEALANLMLSAELFAECCQHYGAFSEGQAHDFITGAAAVLASVGSAQAADAADVDPVLRFIDTLSELIALDKVGLETKLDERLFSAMGREEIGWFDQKKGEVYLKQKTTYTAVSKAMREEGDPMPLRCSTLYSRLRQRRLIKTHEKGKNTTRRNLGGNPREAVVVMDASVLELDGLDRGPATESSAGKDA
jgi:hypothetical protein